MIGSVIASGVIINPKILRECIYLIRIPPEARGGWIFIRIVL